MILYFPYEALIKRFKTEEKLEEYMIEFYPELEIELDEDAQVMSLDGELADLLLFGNHQENEYLYVDENCTEPLIHKNYRAQHGY